MGSGGAAAQAGQDRQRANAAIDQYNKVGYEQMAAGEKRFDSAYQGVNQAMQNQQFQVNYNNPVAQQSLGFLQNFINGMGQVEGGRGMEGIMQGIGELAKGTQAGNDPLGSAFRGQDTQSQYGAMLGQLMQTLSTGGDAQGLNDKALSDAAMSNQAGQQALQAQLGARGFGVGSGIGTQALVQSQFQGQKAVADAMANTGLQVAGLRQQGAGAAGQLYSGLRGQDQQFALGRGSLLLQDASQRQGALGLAGQFQQGINQFDAANLTNRANMSNQLLTTDMNRQQLNSQYQSQLLQMLAGMAGQQYQTGSQMASPQFAQQQYQISNQNAQANAAGTGGMLGGLLNFGAQLLTAPMTGGMSLLGNWLK